MSGQATVRGPIERRLPVGVLAALIGGYPIFGPRTAKRRKVNRCQPKPHGITFKGQPVAYAFNLGTDPATGEHVTERIEAGSLSQALRAVEAKFCRPLKPPVRRAMRDLLRPVEFSAVEFSQSPRN